MDQIILILMAAAVLVLLVASLFEKSSAPKLVKTLSCIFLLLGISILMLGSLSKKIDYFENSTKREDAPAKKAYLKRINTKSISEQCRVTIFPLISWPEKKTKRYFTRAINRDEYKNIYPEEVIEKMITEAPNDTADNSLYEVLANYLQGLDTQTELYLQDRKKELINVLGKYMATQKTIEKINEAQRYLNSWNIGQEVDPPHQPVKSFIFICPCCWGDQLQIEVQEPIMSLTAFGSSIKKMTLVCSKCGNRFEIKKISSLNQLLTFQAESFTFSLSR
jgi:hypothetical protein